MRKQILYFINKLLSHTRVRLQVVFPKLHSDQSGNMVYRFASEQLNIINPANILNIGSHREFILGLTAHYKITTIDIRKIENKGANETIFMQDAEKMIFPDNSFDTVITFYSLCYFGTGEYGKKNLDKDKMAVKEMIRVLKPSGYLLFDVPYTEEESHIKNYTKIYDHQGIKEMCQGLKLIKEEIYIHNADRISYVGCWQKL